MSATKPVAELACDSVTHLEKYLAYYITQLKPGYAVLVTGGWGSGKTFQVRRALPDDRAIYVSLFGLNSPEEIEAHIFTKMFPNKAKLKVLAEKLNSFNLGIPGIASIGTSGIGTALANTLIKGEVDTSLPLILDDLERCSVKTEIIIGLINRYVEHHGCRVIVIAHDEELIGEFKETKEKVFGQTIIIEQNTDAAYKSFIDKFAAENEIFSLGIFTSEALEVFKESKANSLRILRHVVEDVMRLLRVLDSKHLANFDAMRELVRVFSAFSIEYRNNKIGKEDLIDRKMQIYSHFFSKSRVDESQEKPKISELYSKYNLVSLSSMILNDEVLVEMLIQGRFDQQKIQESLNASSYFISEEAASPWQVVIQFDTLDDVAVQKGLDRMNDQLANQLVTESGELLHIFSLQLMMASKGLSGLSVDDVVANAKAYIDSLLKSGKLPPRGPGIRWAAEFQRSFGGYSYWETKERENEWQDVLSHLIEARIEALEVTLPDRAADLLATLQRNGEAFFGRLCFTNNGAPEFDDIPILASIDPIAFVNAWLLSPKQGWYLIRKALDDRYAYAQDKPNMRPEADWLPRIAEQLAVRANAEKGLAKLRIERVSGLWGLPPRPAVEAADLRP